MTKLIIALIFIFATGANAFADWKVFDATRNNGTMINMNSADKDKLCAAVTRLTRFGCSSGCEMALGSMIALNIIESGAHSACSPAEVAKKTDVKLHFRMKQGS